MGTFFGNVPNVPILGGNVPIRQIQQIRFTGRIPPRAVGLRKSIEDGAFVFALVDPLHSKPVEDPIPLRGERLAHIGTAPVQSDAALRWAIHFAIVGQMAYHQ
jgi:hypothetical protein